MNRTTLSSLLLVSAVVLTGCGGGSSENTPIAESAAELRVVKITGNDQMRFDTDEIRVAPGETLRVELTNIGKLPAAAMSHNWVLLKGGIGEDEFVAFANSSAGNAPSYLAEGTDLVLAHTRMLGPGESDTIEFTAPETPGEYIYLCTFPGHYAIMRGVLIVE